MTQPPRSTQQRVRPILRQQRQAVAPRRAVQQRLVVQQRRGVQPQRVQQRGLELQRQLELLRRQQYHAFHLALEPNPLAGIEASLKRIDVPVRIVWGASDDIFAQTVILVPR